MGHVLVVDDDAGIRQVLQALLIDEGYQVSLAQNGQEAIARLVQEPGLLVLLDLMMPVLDGAGVIRWLQATPGRARHKLVLMTATRHQAQEQDWLEAGVIQAVVHKPFDIEEVLAILGQL